MSDTFQFGQHPDADQLSAFAEQALPAHEREQMLVHLAGCNDCRRIVALSLPPLEQSPVAAFEPAVTPRFRGWFSGWRGLWIAAPALAALMVLTVFSIHLRNAAAVREESVRSQRAALPTQMAEVQSPPPREALTLKAKPAAATAAPASRTAAPAGAIGTGVNFAPITGRNLEALKEPAPPGQAVGGVAGMIGGVAGMASGSGAAPVQTPSGTVPKLPYAAPASDQPAVAGPLPGQPEPAASAAAALNFAATENAAAATPAGVALDARAYTLRKNSFVSVLAPLPSGLPVVSFAANLRRRVAIDTQHTLFRSEDEGRHWTPVPMPWPGRAMTVAMVPPAVPHPTIISAGAPSHFAGGTLGSPKPPGQGFARSAIQQSGPPDASGSSLSGRVTDAAGAVVPGAVVLLKQGRTSSATPGIVRAGKTDAAGRYLFANLAPGSYQLEAAAPGFETRSLAEEVAASQHTLADLTLAVGQTSQTVTVTAANGVMDIQPQTAAGAAQKARSSAAKAAAPAPAMQTPPVFVVVTDTGDRWTSADGLSWQREAGKPE